MMKGLFLTAALLITANSWAHHPGTPNDTVNGDNSYFINYPQHGDSRLAFANDSSGSGICRYLGYSGYLSNSMRNGRFEDNTIEIAYDGRIVDGRGDVIVASIVCLGPRTRRHNPESVYVTEPRHPESGLKYANDSSGLGVCRNLGYDGYSPNSMRNGYWSDVAIEVDYRGRAVEGRGDVSIDSLVCLYN